MTPAEVAWRLQRALRVPLDYFESVSPRAVARPRQLKATGPKANYPIRDCCNCGTLDSIRIFDREFPPDFQFNWHCDYKSGKLAPIRFAPSVNTREPRVVGDIKYTWEVNRHQHLSALVFSGQPDAGRLAADALRSWLSANPYLVGVNWSSSLEVALRLISWAFLYPALRSTLETDTPFRQAFEASIHLHMRRIRRNLSLFSSANNHLIGELVGLYCGCICFPWWTSCKVWGAFAKAALEKEALLQFAPDGVNREQAVSYQLFTLELLLLALAVGESSGDGFSAQFRERVRAAVDFLRNLATRTGDLPFYGDSDEGRGFLVSNQDSSFHVVMELAGRLLKEPEFLGIVTKATVAARALLPATPEAAPPQSRGRQRGSVYRAGGIAVLNGIDFKLVMDFGPLGYLRTAAHGHADSLSIWLAVDEQYLLVDAGTYAYHTHPPWRTYFRGTAAHNTVRVDGLDQSVMAGRFLWGTRAAAGLVNFEEHTGMWSLEAQHNGYTRLRDPVVHRRRIDCCKGNLAIRIEDTLACDSSHEVELHWHLHEDAEVTESAQAAIVGFRGRQIRFETCTEGFGLRVVRAGEEPILGWRSPSFGVKIPISTLRFAGRLNGPGRVVTRIFAVR